MKIQSILSALLLMVSSMASAQKYLNVKLEDGTYFSFEATPNMEISFDKTAREERVVVVNGYKVTVKLADNTPASDVALLMYSDGENAKIIAVPKTNKPLRCTRGDNAEVPAPNVGNGVYNFTISGISGISQDVVATVGYDQFTVHFDLLSHGGTAPEDISVMRGTEILTPTADDGYEFRGWYMEPSCIAGTEWNWSQIKANKTDEITLYAKWVTKINGHDCVKLGGIYWATENVTESRYRPMINNVYYYYTQENDDALNAAKSWGNESGHTWTLPSESQFYALMSNCSWSWKSSYPYNGKNVAGMFVTGKKENGEEGHSIFLPVAGIYRNGDNFVKDQGGLGFYWSTDEEKYLKFYDGNREIGTDNSNHAMAVRPVSE